MIQLQTPISLSRPILLLAHGDMVLAVRLAGYLQVIPLYIARLRLGYQDRRRSLVHSINFDRF